MNKILVGKNGCVATAVSTVRAVMGYRTSWPKDVPFPDPDKGMSIVDVIRYAEKFFPKHDIHIWCSEENIEKSGVRKELWKGTSFLNMERNEDTVGMFTYYVKEDEMSHMVVGYPDLYSPMECSLAILVERREKI